MQHVRWQKLPSEAISDNVERFVVWGERGTAARFSFAVDTHISQHMHESEQHTYLVEGQLRINVGGQEVFLHAGEILVIPPWVAHEVWVLEKAVVVDFFAPPRSDWKLDGAGSYLEGR